MQAIQEGAQYVTNGHNVVFGNGGPNQLDASSLRGTFSDASLPNYFVAGDGIDNIDTSNTIDGDVVFGGNGKDLIRVYGNGHEVHGGADGDDVQVWGDRAIVDTEEGNDTISIFGQGAMINTGVDNDTVNVTGTESSIVTGTGQDHIIFDDINSRYGQDYLFDASSDDRLSVGANGSDLTGGAKTPLHISHSTNGGVDRYYYDYAAADQYAYYEPWNTDCKDLRIWSNNGSKLLISDFENGQAGLTINSYAFEETSTLGDTIGVSFMNHINGNYFYSGLREIQIFEDVGIAL